MGPYCRFCDQRCFVPLPMETPEHIRQAYGTASIIATCQGGQAFEREKVGYCLDDIQTVIDDAARLRANVDVGRA